MPKPVSPSPVPDIAFHQSPRTRWGVDCLSLRDLRRRAPHTLLAPQRLGFHLLLLVQAGESDHMVDFEPLRLRSGDVMWLRPGQVQQWQLDDSLQGQILLIHPDAMKLLLAQAHVGRERGWLAVDEWARQLSLTPERAAPLCRLLACMAEVLKGTPPGSARDAAALNHLVLALLLCLSTDLAPQPLDAPLPAVRLMHRLHRLLDETLGQRLPVAELCRRLAVSQSTLARACQATQGLSVKAVVDRRILLEAMRLLVDTEEPASRLAERLGFDEVTNFIKFFRRLEGTTPAAFRQRYR